MKDAGDRWNQMSEEEKKPFQEQHRQMKEKYDNYLSRLKARGVAVDNKEETED